MILKGRSSDSSFRHGPFEDFPKARNSKALSQPRWGIIMHHMSLIRESPCHRERLGVDWTESMHSKQMIVFQRPNCRATTNSDWASEFEDAWIRRLGRHWADQRWDAWNIFIPGNFKIWRAATLLPMPHLICAIVKLFTIQAHRLLTNDGFHIVQIR